MKRHILLVGLPGSGKTTIARRAIELLRGRGIRVWGFWTGEIREAGIRRGFDIESLSGFRSVMAHVDLRQRPTVSKYGVDVAAVDTVAVAEINRAVSEGQRGVVLVMDEIGKMELMSPAFRAAVMAAMDSELRILATAMSKPHPFVDRVKGRPDVEVITVTRANRDSLPGTIAASLAGNG